MNGEGINWTAAIILIAAVVVINIGLWASLAWRGRPSEVDHLRRAADILQHPWQADDRAMAELSRRVSELKETGVVGKSINEMDEHS